MVLLGKKVQIRSFYNYSLIFHSLYSFFQWHVSVSFLVLHRESLFKQWLYCRYLHYKHWVVQAFLLYLHQWWKKLGLLGNWKTQRSYIILTNLHFVILSDVYSFLNIVIYFLILFFRIVFADFFIMNLILWVKGSSAAIPFGTLVAILAMWFGISVPLTFVGAYFGFKEKVGCFECRFEIHLSSVIEPLKQEF